MVRFCHSRLVHPSIVTRMLLSEQFTQLMEAIKTSQKEPSIKLAEFKSEIREMQKRATASVIKKVQLGQEPYSFKTKNSSR